MNEPIRYNATKVVGEYGSVAREQHRLHLAPDANGKWVKWSDYQQLKSTNESFAKNVLRIGYECRDLAKENARLRASSFVTAVPSEEYEKLKAEVERLKADNEQLQNRCDFLEGNKHEDDVRRGRSTAQYNGIIDTQLKVIDELKAEVERLGEENKIRQKDMELLFASYKQALEDIRRLHWDLRAAKEGKQP